MKKIFVFCLTSIVFTGIFALSAPNVSASEIEDNNIIQLEIGKEQTQTKVIKDENGEEEGRITITEVPQEDNGMIQPFGSSVISPNIQNKSYTIEWSNLGGLAYAKYVIDIKNYKITSARNLSYRLPLVSVNGYSLTHGDLSARLNMDLSTDIGGLGTLGSWTGLVDAFIGQGMVVVIWN